MNELQRQIVDDLEDIAALRLGRFAQAHEAEQIACRAIQHNDNVDVDGIVASVEAWWNKHRPATVGGNVQADIHCRMALVESIRHFARGGS